LTWSPIYNLDATGTDTSNGRIWGPSAVVDSTNRDVHIVSITSAGDVNYTKFVEIDNSNSSKTIRATKNSVYPTISLVGSDDLYAYWITSDQIEGNYSTDLGSSWSQITGFTIDVNSKVHLTSVYYAPNSDYIGWHWTKNVAFDNDVLFERIPEFNEIIIPIAGFMALFIVLRGKTKKKKEYDNA
jgi:hypothetical protein